LLAKACHDECRISYKLMLVIVFPIDLIQLIQNKTERQGQNFINTNVFIKSDRFYNGKNKNNLFAT